MTDQVDDFLKGSEPEITPEPETVTVEPETQPEPAPVRDEKGRFAPKGEEPSAPPALEEPQHTIPPKALQEERRKRQEAEDRLTRLEQELQAIRQPQQPPAPAPSLWEDEQGWQDHLKGDVVSTAVQQATLNARLDMSEMMVRQSNPDFEEKKTAFIQLMQENPLLQQKALADPHPWNFAYTYVKNHERMQQLAAVDVTDLENKLREQIRAELEAQKQPETPAPTIPASLADSQSARSSTVPQAPPSLADILSRKG
jgi:hypothetical protein